MGSLPPPPARGRWRIEQWAVQLHTCAGVGLGVVGSLAFWRSHPSAAMIILVGGGLAGFIVGAFRT